MCCGVATTLLIEEPKVNRRDSHYQYSVIDYGRFLALFLLSALAFALTFFFSGFLFVATGQILPPFFQAGARRFSG